MDLFSPSLEMADNSTDTTAALKMKFEKVKQDCISNCNRNCPNVVEQKGFLTFVRSN